MPDQTTPPPAASEPPPATRSHPSGQPRVRGGSANGGSDDTSGGSGSNGGSGSSGASGSTDGWFGRDGLAGVLRFATEIVAWVTTVLALWPVSRALAITAIVVLVGLPTVFATPGDKKQVNVAVPGTVTIGLVIMQFAAAAVASWFAWPLWAAVLTWLLIVAALVTEQPRWRRLTSRSS